MPTTKSTAELLIVAIQDLFDGARAWTERIEGLRESVADKSLSAFVTACGRDAKRAAQRLNALTDEMESPAQDAPNLWLRAELDDAERDAETIVRGPLRDVALIGAFRKAKQSERVSYETALILTRRLKLPHAASELKLLRDEAAAADRTLARHLKAVATRLDA